MQLTSLSPEKYFYSRDGKIFTTIEDLYKGIVDMSEETFSYHVNKEKNDFYNWINFVFCNNELAKAIIKVKTKAGLARKVKVYIQSAFN